MSHGAHESSTEWLSQKAFAERFGYSPRSVSRWVKLGMPRRGQRKNSRIPVELALKWLDAGGASAVARRAGEEARVGASQ